MNKPWCGTILIKGFLLTLFSMTPAVQAKNGVFERKNSESSAPMVGKTNILHHRGTATLSNGKVAYFEHHVATYNSDGSVLRAVTSYLDVDKKLIGKIDSDFSRHLSAPTYYFEDYRSGERHGIRYLSDGQLQLYLKDKNKKEQTITYDTKELSGGLIVGCQGLHYYLRQNFIGLSKMKSLPIKMLVPGKLDYYNFELTTAKSNEDIIRFEIEIESFFLKLFAPKLIVDYDPVTRKLVRYEGLSNIPDGNGDMQDVIITYSDSNIQVKGAFQR